MEDPPELAESLLEAPDVVREDDDVLLLHDVALGRPLAAHRVHGEGAGPSAGVAGRSAGRRVRGWNGGGRGVHSRHAPDGVCLVGGAALKNKEKNR